MGQKSRILKVFFTIKTHPTQPAPHWNLWKFPLGKACSNAIPFLYKIFCGPSQTKPARLSQLVLDCCALKQRLQGLLWTGQGGCLWDGGDRVYLGGGVEARCPWGRGGGEWKSRHWEQRWSGGQELYPGLSGQVLRLSEDNRSTQNSVCRHQGVLETASLASTQWPEVKTMDNRYIQGTAVMSPRCLRTTGLPAFPSGQPSLDESSWDMMGWDGTAYILLLAAEAPSMMCALGPCPAPGLGVSLC